MKKYLKSVITALICFVVVIALNFVLPRALPGDPVAYLSGMPEESMSEEKYQYYYDAMHLGESPLVQFGYYLKSLADGSLGYSYKQQRNVSEIIDEKMSFTLLITVPAFLISSLIGLWWGLGAGAKNGKLGERVSSALNIVINAVPIFVIGLGLMIVFCFKIKAFPYAGLSSVGVKPGTLYYFFDRVMHLALPVSTLVLAQLPSKYLAIRNSAAAAAGSKPVLFAKQRGLSNRMIKWKYIFPGISGPFITGLGLSFGACFGGSLIVENIFSVNGIGTLMTTAIHNLDFPLLQGILFVTTAVMVIAVILCDVSCILFDPQIRFSSKKSKGGHNEK